MGWNHVLLEKLESGSTGDCFYARFTRGHDTVDGRNPAPLGNHKKPLFVMGNHCVLAFTDESSFRGFLGGAGFRPSTVCALSSSFSERQHVGGTGCGQEPEVPRSLDITKNVAPPRQKKKRLPNNLRISF